MLFPFTAFISPGGGEFLLIMLVLILLFGAKDAPRIFRSIHSTLDKIQRTAASFRYKIMYGDIHANTADEEPYDVEADYPEEDETSAELGVQSSRVDPEIPEQTPGNPESGTENPELPS